MSAENNLGNQIHSGKNAKGDELRITKWTATSYSLDVYFMDKWIIVEQCETKQKAMKAYKKFGGK